MNPLVPLKVPLQPFERHSRVAACYIFDPGLKLGERGVHVIFFIEIKRAAF